MRRMLCSTMWCVRVGRFQSGHVVQRRTNKCLQVTLKSGKHCAWLSSSTSSLSTASLSYTIQNVIGGKVNWEVTVSVILSKKVYMYMCPIPNGFRDRAATRDVLTRVAECADVDGGIFVGKLYQLCHLNHKYRY
jgi:hypothetical protein